MSQYKTGTVDVTNGSANVIGNGTLFLANVSAGDLFTVVGDNVFYEVASITSDTALVLSANYAGATKTGRAYTIARDFTTNFGWPFPNQGDIQAALIVKRAIESIDTELNTAGLAGDGREWVDLKLVPTFINSTQFKMTGDHTGEYHVDRRIKCVDATNLFGRISASSFAAGETTVTVVLDSGSLSGSLTKALVGIAGANSQYSISGGAVRGGTPSVDTIAEDTAAAGVTIDGVRLKDSRVEALVDPVNASDAATKSYVDNIAIAGVTWKDPARVATTANVDLATGGLLTIDGVVLAAGDRVLVKDQTTASENGVYDAAAGAWTRSADVDADAEVKAGMAVWVNEGTTTADTGWTLTTDDPITVGTTALTFTQFTGTGGSVNAGAGLVKTGNTLDAVANADGSIVVNADDIQVGALATDAQHGVRGGGTQHSVATTSVAGFMSAVDKTKLDGVETAADVTDEANVRAALAALTADPSVNNRKITSLADPILDQDAATKAYVDANAGGGQTVWKEPVRVASTANINVDTGAGAGTIDGVTLAVGDRVLVKDQTTPSENGIYVAATGAWSRASDANTSAEVKSGMAVWVSEGATQADTGWALSTNDPITLGTTALTFTQFTGIGALIAGDGLQKTGDTLDVVANADGSIVANAGDVQVGVLATDAQHGNRGGGALHSDVVAAGASGFMLGTDKTKLDGIEAGADATLAGAGLTKTGSTLDVTAAVLAKAGNYTVVAGDNTKLIDIDASAAARTITLLAAATAGNGFVVAVRKTDTSVNAVTVDGNAAETIDGYATKKLQKQHDVVWLRSDGANWFSAAKSIAPVLQVFTTTGANTYTKTDGLVAALVEVQAAGGGSGGCAATVTAQLAAAAGGGAGGYARELLVANAIGATETVTVGAGGAAAAAGNNAGGVGGTSSFGTLLSATGGGGGGGSPAVATANRPLIGGASGGVGSGGDFNVKGGASGISLIFDTNRSVAGFGGASVLGGGGRGLQTNTTTVGQAGGNYGGGASGSANGQNQAATAGSAGAQGIVLVWEIF